MRSAAPTVAPMPAAALSTTMARVGSRFPSVRQRGCRRPSDRTDLRGASHRFSTADGLRADSRRLRGSTDAGSRKPRDTGSIAPGLLPPLSPGGRMVVPAPHPKEVRMRTRRRTASPPHRRRRRGRARRPRRGTGRRASPSRPTSSTLRPVSQTSGPTTSDSAQLAPKAGDTKVDSPGASRAPQYDQPRTIQVVRPERTIVRDTDTVLPIALSGAALLVALGLGGHPAGPGALAAPELKPHPRRVRSQRGPRSFSGPLERGPPVSAVRQ